MNIETINFYYDFLNFLKENDCFDKFKNNWYNLKRRSCRGFNREYNNLELYLIPADKFPTLTWDYYYCNIIYDAFPWNSTPEGSNFWHKIHNKWMIYSVTSFREDDFFSGKEN